jgi:hypothetical protein
VTEIEETCIRRSPDQSELWASLRREEGSRDLRVSIPSRNIAQWFVGCTNKMHRQMVMLSFLFCQDRISWKWLFGSVHRTAFWIEIWVS